MPNQILRAALQKVIYIAGIKLVVSLMACQPSRKSTRLIVASAGNITSIDPAQASTFGALQILSSIGDTLYRLDANGKLEPRLATSLPLVSDNGFTLSIPLISIEDISLKKYSQHP